MEVAAALVFREGKLLIAQRFADAHLGGLWEFPGGKREPQESYEECLTRELVEELGIEAEVLDLVEALTHHYPDRTVHIQFFRCRWVAKEPRALGCASFAWISRDELANFTFPAADARLLESLRRDAELWA